MGLDRMRIAFICNRLVDGQGCFVFREARVSICD